METVTFTAIQLQWQESLYVILLRRMVCKGFEKHPNLYRLKIKKNQSHQIIRTETILKLVQKRHMKFVAYRIRRNNNQFLKQLIFNVIVQCRIGRPAQRILEIISRNTGIKPELFLQNVWEKKFNRFIIHSTFSRKTYSCCLGINVLILYVRCTRALSILIRSLVLLVGGVFNTLNFKVVPNITRSRGRRDKNRSGV